MIPTGLFSQIGMIIISVGIIFTYIQPTLSGISLIQDDIFLYQTKFGKVAGVNDRLDSLVDGVRRVSTEDRNRLNTFLPDSVDGIDVSRDLFIIAKEAGLLYVDSQYLTDESSVNSRSVNNSSDDFVPDGHLLELSVEGTYDQIKRLFSLLEKSDYLLELDNLNVSKLEGGFLEAVITLRTYSYKLPEANKQIVF